MTHFGIWHTISQWYGYHIQVGNSLFGSLMGEFPSHLHIMVDLFKSLLEGDYVYCVACPGVHTCQLAGITEWLIPGHSLTLSVVTTENEALSRAQDNHWQIDSQCRLEEIFQQVLNPCMGFEVRPVSGGEDTN